MLPLLPDRISQLGKKLINGSINIVELDEYKSLLELANAIMKVHKMRAQAVSG
ncbi:MAG: hypothetical protein HRT50_16800 [Colwellia sp.]|uniref:hypothetical protein n=1 Tax=Colwellia sp. TaxID=56799 RepID=UPI001DBFF3EA|nr:hypothetical protein [Colwellia sp.]NQY50723.1 hypothetical protein [Colwellia sp.]